MQTGNRTKTVFIPPLPFPLHATFSSPSAGLLNICIHNSFDMVWSPPGGFLQTISALGYMNRAHLRTIKTIYSAFRKDSVNVFEELGKVVEGKDKEMRRIASALEEFIPLLPFLDVEVHGSAWKEVDEPCQSSLSLHHPSDFFRDFDAFSEKLCSFYRASRKVAHFLKSFTLQLPCVEGKGYGEVKFEKIKEGILLDILHPQECFSPRPCRVNRIALSIGYHRNALSLSAGNSVSNCTAMVFDIGCATPLRAFLALIYFHSLLKDRGVNMFEELARELARPLLPRDSRRIQSVLKLGEIVDSATQLARNLNLL